MKLSEAIRHSAGRFRQIVGQLWYKSNVVHDCDGACAMGAALSSIGIPMNVKWSSLDSIVYVDLTHEQKEIVKSWRYIKVPNGCPECQKAEYCNAPSLVYHLNDTHQWNFERIADCIERYEKEIL